ncbi:MAG TPA: HslU--HslV peptidase proteolytic subunit [Firmicutes bacterium]|jgi:ATP-dependent HslUV protease subunit HslV|nr:HslU--HslV peptidase proteolytic subunit [Bacillota bacterium]HAW70535.1 HslU--HslV peptidase proteolytic subunit [Bacillota bacterium]HAZ22943.1 HslU--HslV peptidase proteolytic subunit [Bacillota bacterium]HCF89798.1 HslU--HslV peptidase proteolytic subunit [Bacillota bacterium]HCF91289.1 HslU--HslV peptidase proteolytic subunit [Bacillota bacterium]
MIEPIRGTTILAIRKDGKTAIAGDGQVTMGETVMKHTAKKVRRLSNGRVLAGFAGSVADAFALFEKFEKRLEEYHGNLSRAAVDLAKEWRTDRVLRRLEALLIVADRENLFIISGTGEVVEPDDGIAAVGSGGSYALAAARALARHSNLTAGEIARESLLLASEICIYTNSNIIVEELE